jgi:very-long-chain (3R)-3-hydroxyacyl-CoA dehydratase
LAYNVVSAALWANLLYITISFLLTSRPGSIKATSYWARLIASSPLASVFSSLPSPVAAGSHYLSGSYNYKNLGWLTKWTQTLAVLEVVHAGLGWVRSPVLTTASQVASRVYTVWGVVEAVPKVSPPWTLLIDSIKSTIHNNATRLVTY